MVTALRAGATAIIVACVGLAVASLALRYRRGSDLTRSQLRWIVLAAAISSVAALPYVAFRYLIYVDDSAGEVAAAIAQIGSCALPLAAAFAMSRYRLFDVDVLIGRTLVYLPLMGILGGLYAAGMAVFQRVSVALTGETSDVAGIVAILMVASAFTPVRRALESAIDRRFPARLATILPDPMPPTAGPPHTTADPAGLDRDRLVPSARLLPIDTTGIVRCPERGPVAVFECLTCPHLTATVAGSGPSIVCDPGAPVR
jgi:hypothetical protein